MPIKGAVYRHYKGSTYCVVCVATNEADETPVVVYQSVLEPEKIWVRPLASFMETVEHNNTRIPRFSLIAEQ